MKTVVVLPINALAQAKSRLRDVLDEPARGALVLWMAERVLDAVRESEVIASTAVVSPDPAVLRWAEQRGAVPLRQNRGKLNDGLELGRAWAVEQRSDALLVLLADLPCLAPEDVRDLVRAAEAAGEAAVVLAPDRRDEGTNGMVVRPVELMPFAFGTQSLRRHVRLARAAGAEPVLRRTPATCFDVDTAADLDELDSCAAWMGEGRGTLAHAHGLIERTPAGRLALRHMAAGRGRGAKPLAGEPG